MKINAEEIKSHFKDAFHQVAPEVDFDKINLNLSLRDQVEIDSLDLYNIVVSLQKKTGIYIPDSKLAELSSLSELINYILSENKKEGAINELKS
jgi:acyl carrier protein